MTQRVQKAIDIFLDAINQGHLAKGTCVACAVGNLVAHGMGAKIFKRSFGFDSDKRNNEWHYMFSTYKGKQTFHPNAIYYKEVRECIEATDFTVEELKAIEYTFETNTHIEFSNYPFSEDDEIRKDQIKGLEAVVKVMLNFDDCKENVKEVFTQKAELIPV